MRRTLVHLRFCDAKGTYPCMFSASVFRWPYKHNWSLASHIFVDIVFLMLHTSISVNKHHDNNVSMNWTTVISVYNVRQSIHRISVAWPIRNSVHSFTTWSVRPRAKNAFWFFYKLSRSPSVYSFRSSQRASILRICWMQFEFDICKRCKRLQSTQMSS